MSTESRSIPVSDFIRQSERNLRVAGAVYEHFESAREQLVSAFFDRLGAEILKKLKGWEWKYEPKFFLTRWGGFLVWKPGWENQYCLRLEAYDWGEKMVYGIWRDEGQIGGRPRSPKLLEKIKKQIPSARSRAWFEAEIVLHSPAPDWRKPEVLWRMHSDPAFLQEVAIQILEVANLSEKTVDSLVQEYAEHGRASI